MKYYYAEHEAGYRSIEQHGGSQWDDLFVPDRTEGFDVFPHRGFLERVLPALDLPAPDDARALEYGCGTGPCVCFLAAQGFRVELTPEMLRGELTRAGFHVESQDGRLGGDLVCRTAATPKPSGQA